MLNVLHLDGSGFFIKVLKQQVERIGFHYLHASTLAEGWEIIRRRKVDLIITALEFSDGNAEQMVGELNRTEFKRIPVIVITSNDTAEERHRMFNLGVIDYILKDSSESQLANYMEKFRHEDRLRSNLEQLQIAVVDDSPVVCRVIDQIFQVHRIRNVDYYHTAGALKSSGKDYDLYLLDVNLPGSSGAQLVLEMRQQVQNAVIIAISAHNHYKLISSVLLAGADDYIMKPFNEPVFIARLKANVRTFRLLKEIEEKNNALRELSLRDSLTGLFNHKHILERLDEEVAEAARFHRPLSVAMFDLDKFKQVNDTLGHQQGDRVLKLFADTAQRLTRKNDIVGRYGGEEFVVVLPETAIAGAKVLIDRIRVGFSRASGGDGEAVTVTAGLVEYNGESGVELLKRADALLYQGKKNGRNRVETGEQP